MLEAKAIADGTRSLDAAILEFAGSNRLGEIAHVLATISRLPEAFVRAALFRRDGTAIALVCCNISLKDDAFEEVTRLRCSQFSLDASDGHKLPQAYRSMDIEPTFPR